MANRILLLATFLLATTPNTAAGDAGNRPGKDVVASVCSACHQAGLNGAPRTGDREAWIPRMKRGLNELSLSAIRGHAGMPARGGQAALTDSEIRNAIFYMWDPEAEARAASRPAAAPARARGPNDAVVNGIEVNFGLVTAERLRAYPWDSPERLMHGGAQDAVGDGAQGEGTQLAVTVGAHRDEVDAVLVRVRGDLRRGIADRPGRGVGRTGLLEDRFGHGERGDALFLMVLVHRRPAGDRGCARVGDRGMHVEQMQLGGRGELAQVGDEVLGGAARVLGTVCGEQDLHHVSFRQVLDPGLAARLGPGIQRHTTLTMRSSLKSRSKAARKWPRDFTITERACAMRGRSTRTSPWSLHCRRMLTTTTRMPPTGTGAMFFTMGDTPLINAMMVAPAK